LPEAKQGIDYIGKFIQKHVVTSPANAGIELQA
jgi:hypothetical protein